ncbi:GGDEF domain-containing protein [Dyella sp.]|jgi:diguanylate cyclase (GGDEF)-like protein|uniref:GGDEF domain-containing protein n=1 Tax=Dyella sp. TaxID=1869338 RepID=UPI002D785797|nr:GGDEF domain-containing protein [Dyella sp.]HET6432749.1 GGDEF domain-containing protein [Dyella sp.]
MPVQVETLSLLNAVQALALAIMLWVGTHGDGGRGLLAIRLRAGALGLEAAGYALLAMQAFIPPAGLLMGGNALNLLAQMMVVVSIRLLVGKPLRLVAAGAIALIGWGGVAWLGIVHPDYRLRVLWGSVAIIGNVLLNIDALRGGCRDSGTRARCVLLWVYLLALALVLWRNGALWLGVNPPDQIATPSPVNVFYILLSGMQPLFASIGFLLLYNEILRRELHDLARVDPLTGVANRRAIGEASDRMLDEARAWRGSVGVLLVDADYFKEVNDRFGHDGGDKVLQSLVGCIQRILRADDIVGRVGGEEFLVLSPGVDAVGVAVLAERIRATVANSALRIDDQDVHLTVSIGTAVAGPGHWDMTALRRRADAALYAAKRAGRNRVMAAVQDDDPLPATTQPA